MKKFSLQIAIVMLLCSIQSKSQVLTFSITPQNQCFVPFSSFGSAAVTSTPAGATSFSWSGVSSSTCVPNFTTNGGSTSIGFPCSAVYTITCIAYNGSTPISTAAVTSSVMYSTPLSYSGNINICAGATTTISLFGGTSYTTNPGSMMGNNIVVTPSASIVYTVVGPNAFGCLSTTTIPVTVQNSPTVTVAGAGSGSVCTNGFNLTASGATNYTWFPGSLTGSTVSYTPLVNSCFTVIGSNSCGTGVAVKCVTVLPAPTVALLTNTQVCIGSSTSLFASGGTSYLWTNFMGNFTTTAAPFVFTPTATTAFSLTAYNSFGCSAQMTFTLVPAPSPTTSISGNAPVCVGGSLTLVASGGTTYTWSTGANTSSIVVSPTVNTCYSVAVGGSATCAIAYTNVCVVLATPTISIGGASTLCAGGSISLLASGANTYSWNNGGTSALNVISPTSSGCYTVSGTNGNGCIGSAVKCITVNPLPVISVTGNNTLCSGNSTTLSASGAINYVWSNSTTGPTISTTPLANTCYSVIGTSVAGCSAWAAYCVTVQPSPTITISGNSTVCAGTSANLSASGASSYTWSTGPQSTTINVMPIVSTIYTVSGTNSNNCLGIGTKTVSVDTTCADVWPGDANSNGIVGTSDILEIGLAFSSTGTARTPGGNTYVAQYANKWAGTVSSGKNKCHADCNGDGIVNNADTVAISNNFSLSHSFKPSEEKAGGDLRIETDQNLAYPGQWNKANIILGDSINPWTILGVAFDLNIDQTFLEANSCYVMYPSSFLNASNQNVEFKKSLLSNDKIFCATVRTDQSNVNGSGIIAELWFKVKSDVASGSMINISINNQKAIEENGNSPSITGGSANLEVSHNLVGIKKNGNLQSTVNVYPNPAKELLTLKTNSPEKVRFVIINLLGQEVINGEFKDSKTISLIGLSNGVYFVKIETNSGTSTKRFVKED